ncbi:putative glycosyl transferase [Cyanobacterium stanieri PCC 7202]|uniref:Glycosyl transferase n=1 Tax=Cyanobacterium stanieri (strain ATCC 29140 / PCC 7202) TaxID=292563 RepID=K9YHZ9_CYASC|nr:putative glycosyl transferase [Cyanobacterium stanieri PCC 7202]
MKINWFSPLPPAKTEIAKYTYKIVSLLQKNAEVTIWTSQDKWDSELNDIFSIRYYQPHQMSWYDINQADLNIYQLGNNHLFHGDIWQVSCKCPGLVILHDYKLQDFFYMLSADKKNYLRQVFQLYGEKALADGQKFLDGFISMATMADTYPMTPLALQGVIALMTHNQQSYQQLSEENKWITGYTPLPYLAENPEQIHRRPQQIPYQIIMFGFMGQNRCLNSIFKTLAMLPRREQFRLNIYGEMWDKNYIVRQIQELGLENIIKIHGFVSEEKLNHALSQANLAINLRYPSMGEASASQLHLWSYSLPSIVSQTEWYASLNPKAVAFVRPNHELEDLTHHLNQFLDHPQKFAQMGIEGKKILQENHQPERCAEAILHFATKVIKHRPSHTIHSMTQKIGNTLNNADLLPSVDLNRYSEIIDFLCSPIFSES